MPNYSVLQSESLEKLHVAIIMDGNGRWAAQRGLARIAGHYAGATAVRNIVECAPGMGITCLTLYAFSSDNWRRPAPEVQGIFLLLRTFIRRERERLRKAGVRLEAIGRRDRIPKALLREIELAEAATAEGRNLSLRVAIDYSSRDAIAQAAADAGSAFRDQTPQQMSEAIAQRLESALEPRVDLLIRTGGEKRLSDFLLWESAYAELLFTDCMWPAFSPDDLHAAVDEFQRRERRFGGLPASIAVPQPLLIEEAQ